MSYLIKGYVGETLEILTADYPSERDAIKTAIALGPNALGSRGYLYRIEPADRPKDGPFAEVSWDRDGVLHIGRHGQSVPVGRTA